MVWNTDKDILLCREMLVVEPYRYKEKTRERGVSWTQISDNLNLIPGFTVNIRAVRERFKLLEGKFKKKYSEELKATGISPDISELDTLLEEIIARMKEVTFEDDENKKKEQDDKKLGEDIRLQALETFAETRSRKPEDDVPCKKKKRSSGNETVSFLRERMANEEAFRERELEFKKNLQEDSNQTQTNMMNAMNNSMQQMQQVTASFIQAQTAQTQALYALLEKFSKE